MNVTNRNREWKTKERKTKNQLCHSGFRGESSDLTNDSVSVQSADTLKTQYVITFYFRSNLEQSRYWFFVCFVCLVLSISFFLLFFSLWTHSIRATLLHTSVQHTYIYIDWFRWLSLIASHLLALSLSFSHSLVFSFCPSVRLSLSLYVCDVCICA